MFRLRKEKPNEKLKVEIASINELKRKSLKNGLKLRINGGAMDNGGRSRPSTLCR